MTAAPETMSDDDTGTDRQNEGRWNQLAGKVREMYGDVVGDEMEQFKGNMQQAKGWLQEKYGDVEEEFGEFFESESDEDDEDDDD